MNKFDQILFKKIYLLVVFSSYIFSCTLSQEKGFSILSFDQFEEQNKNLILAHDIANYMFPLFLEKRFPELKGKNTITWQLHSESKDEPKEFQLILRGEALKRKDEIITFFEKIVNEQIEYHRNKEKLFNQAVDFADLNLHYADNYQFDSIWNNLSEGLKAETTLEGFRLSYGDRNNVKQFGGQRIYHSKQFYNEIPGTEFKDIYVVNFTFEKDSKMIEQMTLKYIEKKFQIVGYRNHFPIN